MTSNTNPECLHWQLCAQLNITCEEIMDYYCMIQVTVTAGRDLGWNADNTDTSKWNQSTVSMTIYRS